MTLLPLIASVSVRNLYEKTTSFPKKNYFMDAFGNMLNFTPRTDTKKSFELYNNLLNLRSRDDMKIIERDFFTVGNDMKKVIERYTDE